MCEGHQYIKIHWLSPVVACPYGLSTSCWLLDGALEISHRRNLGCVGSQIHFVLRMHVICIDMCIIRYEKTLVANIINDYKCYLAGRRWMVQFLVNVFVQLSIGCVVGRSDTASD